MAGVDADSMVTVFGAGPVGLLSAYSSIIKGASEVYIGDSSQKRLSLAESIGAVPINFTKEDSVQQINDKKTE